MHCIVRIVYMCAHVPRDGERCPQVVRHRLSLSQVDGDEISRVSRFVSFRTDFSSQKNAQGAMKDRGKLCSTTYETCYTP